VGSGLIRIKLFVLTIKLVRLRSNKETRNEHGQSMQSYRELEADAVLCLIFIQPYSGSLFHSITKIRMSTASIV
jgi:hypothetical protein